MADLDLERFVTAQAGIYEQALGELRRGRKSGHWMWFVFPQIAGLGRSANAWHFGLRDIDEARAYLGHSILGPRLLTCVEALLSQRGRSADAIFGPLDAMKLRSSMTLFERVAEHPAPFAEVLEAFFDGERDGLTLERVAAADRP
ncbi:DUF1810 domain-containing protein [Sphingosinicella terrae]|uniref:DUF1810 domain-containing protein n=1 Tax=Sphingosinicella terrae TaxID=2172047 RepID=UPI000E0CF3B1|nr:DUF1810 domain-containing protein [Sphingosinicella terrae]